MTDSSDQRQSDGQSGSPPTAPWPRTVPTYVEPVEVQNLSASSRLIQLALWLKDRSGRIGVAFAQWRLSLGEKDPNANVIQNLISTYGAAFVSANAQEYDQTLAFRREGLIALMNGYSEMVQNSSGIAGKSFCVTVVSW